MRCLDCISSSCQGKEKWDKELLVQQFPGLPIFLACKKVHFNLTLVTNECLTKGTSALIYASLWCTFGCCPNCFFS